MSMKSVVDVQPIQTPEGNRLSYDKGSAGGLVRKTSILKSPCAIEQISSTRAFST